MCFKIVLVDSRVKILGYVLQMIKYCMFSVGGDAGLFEQ